MPAAIKTDIQFVGIAASHSVNRHLHFFVEQFGTFLLAFPEQWSSSKLHWTLTLNLDIWQHSKSLFVIELKSLHLWDHPTQRGCWSLTLSHCVGWSRKALCKHPLQVFVFVSLFFSLKNNPFIFEEFIQLCAKFHNLFITISGEIICQSSTNATCNVGVKQAVEEVAKESSMVAGAW